MDLGLRDYRWLGDALPGRVAPTDLDALLERKGHFLVLEYKPPGMPLPMGQRITLRSLVKLGMDVWVVWGDGPEVEVGAMDRRGEVPFVEKMSVGKLRRRVKTWFEEVE